MVVNVVEELQETSYILISRNYLEMLMEMPVSDLHDAGPHSWAGIGIST